MAARQSVLMLAAAAALALAGCKPGATENPNAPGQPGTGNPTQVVTPSAPDTPPGGPSGVKGSLPHPGSSGGDAVPGTTGSGTSDASGHSQAAQPGTGLQGGLGASAAASSPAPGGPTSAPSGTAPGTGGSSQGQTGNR